MQYLHPIGIFDSGIGGTSIWSEIHQLLPFENTIYFADSSNAPYGQKTKAQIVDLCFKNMDFLLSKNCKLIVVACNTATTNAIAELRANYSIPIIGIEPAIKPATVLTQTNKIGVLATKGTLSSNLFSSSLEQYSHIEFVEQIGYNLVQLIESGQIDSEEMDHLLKSYLDPMITAGIDALVLGCTHYPYLIPKIKALLPDHIQIIDSGKAVAKQTRKVLKELDLLNDSNQMGSHQFYTNKDVEILRSFVGTDRDIQYIDI